MRLPSSVFLPVISSVLFLFLSGCVTALIPRERIDAWNRELMDRKFRTTSGVGADFLKGNQPDFFQKGDVLGIWLEGSMDWVRVKGYRTDTDREQAIGKR